MFRCNLRAAHTRQIHGKTRTNETGRPTKNCTFLLNKNCNISHSVHRSWIQRNQRKNRRKKKTKTWKRWNNNKTKCTQFSTGLDFNWKSCARTKKVQKWIWTHTDELAAYKLIHDAIPVCLLTVFISFFSSIRKYESETQQEKWLHSTAASVRAQTQFNHSRR